MINREWTQCEGKVAFHERPLAERAAGRRAGRNVYKCEICRMYHVGTRTDGVKKPNRPYYDPEDDYADRAEWKAQR